MFLLYPTTQVVYAEAALPLRNRAIGIIAPLFIYLSVFPPSMHRDVDTDNIHDNPETGSCGDDRGNTDEAQCWHTCNSAEPTSAFSDITMIETTPTPTPLPPTKENSQIFHASPRRFPTTSVRRLKKPAPDTRKRWSHTYEVDIAARFVEEPGCGISLSGDNSPQQDSRRTRSLGLS